MEYKRILYEKVDPNIVKITMNRPEARNAEKRQVMNELAEAFIMAEEDSEAEVVILAGAEPIFFASHLFKSCFS